MQSICFLIIKRAMLKCDGNSMQIDFVSLSMSALRVFDQLNRCFLDKCFLYVLNKDFKYDVITRDYVIKRTMTTLFL